MTVRELNLVCSYDRYNKYEPWRNRVSKPFSQGVERKDEPAAPFYTTLSSLAQLPAPPMPTPVPSYNPDRMKVRQATQ